MARLRFDFGTARDVCQSQPAPLPRGRQRVWAALMLWRRHARDRRRLAMLSDRSLRDIGLSRAMVDFELSQPSWRELRDRRG